MRNLYIVMTDELFSFSRNRIFDSNAIAVLSGLFIIMFNNYYGLPVDVLKKKKNRKIPLKMHLSAKHKTRNVIAETVKLQTNCFDSFVF